MVSLGQNTQNFITWHSVYLTSSADSSEEFAAKVNLTDLTVIQAHAKVTLD